MLCCFVYSLIVFMQIITIDWTGRWKLDNVGNFIVTSSTLMFCPETA